MEPVIRAAGEWADRHLNGFGSSVRLRIYGNLPSTLGALGKDPESDELCRHCDLQRAWAHQIVERRFLNRLLELGTQGSRNATRLRRNR